MEHMTVADIIKAANEGNPTEVQNAFNGVIQAKMTAALDARAEDMINSLYGSSEEDDYEVEYEDVEGDESEVEAYDDQDLDNLDTEEFEDEDI